MKAVICVGLLVVAFVFGVRSEPAIKQGVEVAGKKLDAVLTVEDQIRAAKVEVRRLEQALVDQKRDADEVIVNERRMVNELDRRLEDLSAERDAIAAEKAKLVSELEARDVELAQLRALVHKVGNELTCAPETPVSVLAVE